ncbi:MAG: GNAT family N-acetyltransferase [Ferruginibacter sp.]
MAEIINISPLIHSDIEELITLVNSAYRGESSKKGWTTEAELLDGIRASRPSIESMLQQPGAMILAAKTEAGCIAGCVYLKKDATHLCLGMLTVAPDIQAKGIGKQLLLAAENYGREMDCTSIIMSVIDVRHELIDWYMRKGYQSTGETKPFPNDPAFGIAKQPLQFIILEKRL